MAILVGTAKNEVPSNGDLGSLAYQAHDEVNITNGRVSADEYQKSYSAPVIKPSLSLPFTKTVDPRIDVDRNSPKAYYGQESVLAEENLLKYSEDFNVSSGGWSPQNGTVTANNELSPNSTFTAETFTANGTTNTHALQQTITFAEPYFISVYAKAGTNNFVQIFVGGTTLVYANFDLVNGTVGVTGANNLFTEIEPSANGFYRISIGASTPITSVSFAIVTDNNSARAEANTLTTSIILWGAQLETARAGQIAPSVYEPTLAYPVRNYIPQLKFAPANTLVREFDPVTGEELGIEPESASTNLLLQSEGTSNPVWLISGGVVKPDVAISPDGQLSADLTIANSGSSSVTRQNVNINAGSYTISVYAKGFGSGRRCSIQAYDNNTFLGSVFLDFDNENFQTSIITGGFQSVGNGWYRVWANFTLAAASPNFNLRFVDVVGNGYSGLLLWGAQLEASTLGKPSSYIPTVASQVTRGNSYYSLTEQDFNLSQSEGAIIVDFSSQADHAGRFDRVFELHENSSTDRISVSLNNNSFNYFANIAGNNIVNVAENVTRDLDKSYRVCVTFKNGYIAFFRDGLKIVESIGFVNGEFSVLNIGSRGNNNDLINGFIRYLAYYPKALTAEEAQFLSRNDNE